MFRKALLKLRPRGHTANSAGSVSSDLRPPSPRKPAHPDSTSTPAEADSEEAPTGHGPVSDVKDGVERPPSRKASLPDPSPAACPPPANAADEIPGPEGTDRADASARRDSTSEPPEASEESPPTLVPFQTPEEHAESLWSAAYGSLKEEKPDLVRQYELDVLACMSGRDRRDFRLGSLAGAILSFDYDAGAKLPASGLLIGDFMEAYLDDRSQYGRSDIGKDDPGRASSDDDYDPDGRDVDELPKAWDKLRDAMRRSQYAPTPWVALCIALEGLLHANSQPTRTQLGVFTLASKMEWYIGLSKLLYQEDQRQAQHPLGEPDWASPVGALLGLYRAILSYQIHTASCALGARGRPYPGQVLIGPAELEEYEEEVRIREEALTRFSGPDLEDRLAKAFGVPTTSEHEGVTSVDGTRGTLSEKSSEQTSVRRLEESTGNESDDFGACLEALDVAEQRIPDLDVDEDTAPMLLYRRARATAEFDRFVATHAKSENRVLWLEGGPGTGKTQLLRAAVKALPEEGQGKVAYFFCDSGLPKRGRALDVVKGLIFHLLDSHGQPSLRSCLRNAVSDLGRRQFDDPSDFYAMAAVLYSLLHAEEFQPTYFVVDGIEELVADKDANSVNLPDPTRETEPRDPFDARGLGDLLGLIYTTIDVSDKIRWLISVDESRCPRLRSVTKQGLCITISPGLDAAGTYLSSRLDEISRKAPYWSKLRGRIEKKLHDAEVSNFLWLKTALDIMGASRTPWDAPDTLDKLLETSRDIGSLYRERMAGIAKLDKRHLDYCMDILSAAAVAYEPLFASELGEIVSLPQEVDVGILIDEFLSSFLELCTAGTLGEGRVGFTHLAARDFVRRDEALGSAKGHAYMAESCLRVLLRQLGCQHDRMLLGNPCDGDKTSNNYAALYWLRHLLNLDDNDRKSVEVLACHVLEKHWPRWLEMLDLQGSLLEALSMINKANASLKAKTPGPRTRIHQAIRNIGGSVRGLQMWVRDDDENVKAKHNLLYRPNLRPRWLAQAPTLEINGGAFDSCRVVMNHSDWVRACGFSPDGRLVATASDEGLVRLWDAETGRLQKVLGGFGGYVKSMAISHSGPWGRPLLAASDNDVIRIWDLTTSILVETVERREVDTANKQRVDDREDEAENGEETVRNGDDASEGGRASPHTPPTRPSLFVFSIAITSDGDRLAAATDDGIIIRDILGSQKAVLRDGKDKRDAEAENPNRVSFSPDGHRLAVSAGPKIIIWDPKAEKVVHRLPRRRPRQLGVVPEEEKTAAEGPNGEEPSDDRSDGERIKEEELDEGEPGVEESGGGRLEQMVSEEGRSVDEESKEGGRENEPGHTDNIDGLAFSPDSRFVASGSDDKTARIWDVETGAMKAVLCYHDSHVNGVAFSPDGASLATVSTDKTIGIWRGDANCGWGDGEVRTRPHRVLEGHTRLVWSAAFEPHGVLLATAAADKDARVWDLDAAEEAGQDEAEQQQEEPDGDSQPPAVAGREPGHTQSVQLVAISLDGKMIASASEDRSVCLWDGETGALRSTIEQAHDSSVRSLVFSLDGTRLVSTSSDSTAWVWDVGEDHEPAAVSGLRLRGHSDWVRGAAVSPNGRRVATASDDKSVRVWETAHAQDGEVPFRVLRKNGHTDYAISVAFSPDGGRLASVGDDCHVLIWDLASEGDESEPVANMSDDRLSSYMRGVVFSACGRWVLTVNVDGTVAVWDPQKPSGEQCLFNVKSEFPRFTSLRIDAAHPDTLLTECGPWAFGVSKAELEKLAADPSSGLPQRKELPPWSPLSFDTEAKWILWNGKKLIFLPSEFRPAQSRYLCYQVLGFSAVIGCDSGRVLLFRLSEDVRPNDPEHGLLVDASVP